MFHGQAMAALAAQIEDNLKLQAEIERLRAEIGRVEETLCIYTKSAQELSELLRDKWNCPDVDAMTLYLVSLLCGVQAEWLLNIPDNGFIASTTLPEVGKVEIAIRRFDGKSAAESLRELQAENDRLSHRIEVTDTNAMRAYAQEVIGLTREIERLNAVILRFDRASVESHAVERFIDRSRQVCTGCGHEFIDITPVPKPGDPTHFLYSDDTEYAEAVCAYCLAEDHKAETERLSGHFDQAMAERAAAEEEPEATLP